MVEIDQNRRGRSHRTSQSWGAVGERCLPNPGRRGEAVSPHFPPPPFYFNFCAAGRYHLSSECRPEVLATCSLSTSQDAFHRVGLVSPLSWPDSHSVTVCFPKLLLLFPLDTELFTAHPGLLCSMAGFFKTTAVFHPRGGCFSGEHFELKGITEI